MHSVHTRVSKLTLENYEPVVDRTRPATVNIRNLSTTHLTPKMMNSGAEQSCKESTLIIWGFVRLF